MKIEDDNYSIYKGNVPISPQRIAVEARKTLWVSDENGKTFSYKNSEWLQYDTDSIDIATNYDLATTMVTIGAIDAYGAYYIIKVAEQIYMTNAR